MALAIFFMIVTAATTAGLAKLLGPAFGLLGQTGRTQSPIGSIWIFPLEVLGVLWLRAMASYIQQSRIDTVGERVVTAAQRDMFHSLVRRDLASLNAVHSGSFMSNFLYDATLMRDAITKGIAGVALEFVTLAGLVGLMIYADWRLTLFVAIAVPGVAWAMERIGSSIRRTTTRNMEETGSLSTVISEALDGRRVIKAYGLEAYSSKHADAEAGHATEATCQTGAHARGGRTGDGYIRGRRLLGHGSLRAISNLAWQAASGPVRDVYHRHAARAAAGAKFEPAFADRFHRDRRGNTRLRHD